MPSVPAAPREAYPLVEYILHSSSEGLIKRGRSSELEEQRSCVNLQRAFNGVR